MTTELIYLRDAYLREFDAVVVDVRDGAVALDQTAFYPTGGGQPHDVGTIGGLEVVDVRKEGDAVWHSVAGDAVTVRRRHGARCGRLDAAPPTDAHSLCVACAVWRDLERVAGAGHRRQHGAAERAHGLRVRPASRRVRAPRRATRQRRTGSEPADRGVVPSTLHGGDGRGSHPHQSLDDPGIRAGDPCGRHRRARQTSRWRHPRADDWRSRSHPR